MLDIHKNLAYIDNMRFTWLAPVVVALVIVGAVIGLIGYAIKSDSHRGIQSVSYDTSSNTNVVVELVLEHEGIKVYRFWDGWRYVYYTDARGQTAWEEAVRSGKTVHYVEHTVDTVK